jgi:hypothetical protein
VANLEKPPSDLHLDIQLLPQLPVERLPEGFSFFSFSARKFPEAGHQAMLRPFLN